MLSFSYTVYSEEPGTTIEVQGYIQKSEKALNEDAQISSISEIENQDYVLGSKNSRLPELSERWFSYFIVLGVILAEISFILAIKGVDKDEEE